MMCPERYGARAPLWGRLPSGLAALALQPCESRPLARIGRDLRRPLAVPRHDAGMLGIGLPWVEFHRDAARRELLQVGRQGGTRGPDTLVAPEPRLAARLEVNLVRRIVDI